MFDCANLKNLGDFQAEAKVERFMNRAGTKYSVYDAAATLKSKYIQSLAATYLDVDLDPMYT